MATHIRRRELIAALGGLPVVWPLVVRAQQPTMPVVGYIGGQSPDLWAGRLRAFHQGLSQTGYIEGRNVAIEYRWAEGQYDRLPAFAAELVRRQVTVIAAPAVTPAVVAAKAATTSIPIVFLTAADPVNAGLVASLNRPGGNVTGVTALSVELGPKHLQLLHESVPTANMFALLINPTSAILAETQSSGIPEAARSLGLQIHVLHAATKGDFDGVFASLVQLRAGGLVIGGEALFTSGMQQIAALALRFAVPAIYQFREFAVAGGLMSYGGSLMDEHRLVGVYVGRILKGEKAADLPVERTTKMEFVLNLKTAKALGIKVPLPLLGRADEVIE
jgi:putative tryptophan/tyrosine transport system substrate-binding protein